MAIIDLIKGFITAILVLILIVSVPLLIFSNTIKSTLLQQSFYETQLQSQGGYIQVQAAMLDGITNAFPDSTLNTIGASRAELRDALAQSITVDWVQGEMNGLIQNTLWYLTNQIQADNLSISVRPKIVTGISQLAAVRLNISESDAEAFVGPEVANNVPDPVDLTAYVPGADSTLAQAKSFVTIFLQVSGLLLMVTIAVLLLILLLTFDPVKFASTVGWPMLVVGVLLTASSFIMPGILVNALSNSGVPQANATITAYNVVDFVRPLFSDITVQSIILVVISALLIAFSFIYPRMSGKKK